MNAITLVSYFKSQTDIELLTKNGYLQAQLSNFKRYLLSIPLVEVYSVSQFHFPQEEYIEMVETVALPTGLEKAKMELDYKNLQKETFNLLSDIKQLKSVGLPSYKTPSLPARLEVKPTFVFSFSHSLSVSHPLCQSLKTNLSRRQSLYPPPDYALQFQRFTAGTALFFLLFYSL